jgi:hypothetical protein
VTIDQAPALQPPTAVRDEPTGLVALVTTHVPAKRISDAPDRVAVELPVSESASVVAQEQELAL